MHPDPTLIQRLIDNIVETVHPLRIILFGSAARGDMRRNSDLDVLVVMPDGTCSGNILDRLYDNVGGFGIPIDFLVTTPEKMERYKNDIGYIYRTIRQEGRELYAA